VIARAGEQFSGAAVPALFPGVSPVNFFVNASRLPHFALGATGRLHRLEFRLQAVPGPDRLKGGTPNQNSRAWLEISMLVPGGSPLNQPENFPLPPSSAI